MVLSHVLTYIYATVVTMQLDKFYMPVFRLEMVPSFHQTNIVSPKMLTSFVIRLSIYR